MTRVFDAMKRADVDGTEPFESSLSERSTAYSAELLDTFEFDVEGRADRTEGAIDRPAPPMNHPRAATLKPAGSLTRWSAEPFHEYMAGLVQRIFLTPERGDDQGAVRSLMFTAAGTGQPSPLLAAAAAEILSLKVVGSVCLVDANFRAPSLHRHYDVTNDSGLAQALSGVGPIRGYATRLVQARANSLWLMPAGSGREPGSLLLNGEPGRSRFRALLKAFDYIVIETAPMTGDPVAAILGAEADGVVLVVDANVTRRHGAQAAAGALRASGAKVFGTVLKNRTFPIPEAIYRRL
jgi:Mrp family chromosome partitioning ATPase